MIGRSVRSFGIRILFAAVVLAAGQGCAPKNNSPLSLKRSHTEAGWVTPGTPEFHGSFLQKKGFNTDSCAPCHAEAENKWQSCWDCHTGFPKQPDTVPASHGAGINSKENIASCVKCHETDSNKEKTKPACTDCHAYPHPEGYKVTHPANIQAGVTILGEVAHNPEETQKNFQGPNKCLPCHENSIESKKGFIPGCKSCHAPGKYGFTEHKGLISAHAEQAKIKPGACLPCHAPTETTDPSKATVFFDAQGDPYKPPLCAECHTASADPSKLMHWGIPEWGPSSQNPSGMHPFSLYEKSCVPCHGEYPTFNGKSYKEKQIIRGCTVCHAGFYGKFEHKDPIKTHLPHLEQTAKDLGVPVTEAAGKRCFTCHGLEANNQVADQYTGKQKEIPSCVECHTQGHLEAGWQEKHQPEVGKNGFGQCAECHGEDFGGKGLVTGCTPCHSKGKQYGAPPHLDSNWKLNGHGIYVKSNGIDQCAVCHLTNDPSKTETSWPDGTKIATCYKCHDGPGGLPASHGIKWGAYSPADPKTHSGYLLTNKYDPATWIMDLGECTSCHYDNNKLWATCATCHASYPLEHIADNTNWMTPKNPNSHSEKYPNNYNASCATNCHGADLKGGSSQVTCFLCHTKLP